MNNRMKKVMLVGGLSVLLAACSNNGDGESGSSDGKLTLDMWIFGTTGYDELAKVYMEENPDIEINVQTTEMGDHHNNLFTSLSAGSGAPDIAMVEVAEIERYRDAKDRFTNLYDLGAGDLQESYLDWVWDVGQSEDGEFMYGLPTDIGPTAMFYRPSRLVTSILIIENTIMRTNNTIAVADAVPKKLLENASRYK